MMWEIAAGLGRLAWPWLKGLVPWAGPKLTMGGTLALLALIAIGAPVGAMWLHMRGEVTLCERSCDLRWETKLLREKDIHDKHVDDAVEGGQAELPTPADRTQRLQLCERSPTCREHRR